MVGQTVREQRLKKGLTQAKLARLAGVSRRHLAALEKGANVSVLVLRKVASVLELAEIQLDTVALRMTDPAQPQVNVPLVSESLREVHMGLARAEAMLARAEGLIGGEEMSELPPGVPSHGTMTAQFPRMPVRRFDTELRDPATGLLREGPEWLQVRTAGDLRQGEPIDESRHETIVLPASLIERGEIVFRARGDKLRDQGIEDGDLLVVQLRTKGKAATGELVIGRIGENVYVGRWWQKHGQKALMSDGLSEVTLGRSRRVLKVVAVINQIVRPGR